jgi:hypothetical protein
VNEHVRATPSLIDVAHHPGDITGYGDIGLNRHRLATLRADGRHHPLCLRGAGAMIDDYPKPLLREDRRRRRTDSPAGTRDQRNTTLHCYLRLAQPDNEVQHRTPPGGGGLTVARRLRTASSTIHDRLATACYPCVSPCGSLHGRQATRRGLPARASRDFHAAPPLRVRFVPPPASRTDGQGMAPRARASFAKLQDADGRGRASIVDDRVLWRHDRSPEPSIRRISKRRPAGPCARNSSTSVGPWAALIRAAGIAAPSCEADRERFNAVVGHASGVILVRPDGYVGFVGGKQATGRHLAAYCERWLTPQLAPVGAAA